MDGTEYFLKDYQVSDDGRVFSFKRNRRQELSLFPNDKGYLKVSIHRGTQKSYLVHRLVMITFVGPSELQVAHRDGNPANSQLDNLYYATQKENEADKKEHGTYLSGATASGVRIGEFEVAIIRGLLQRGFTQRWLAQHFGISQSNVSSIKNNQTWIGIEPLDNDSVDYYLIEEGIYHG